VNGKVKTDFNNSYDVATSLVLQGNKIMLGGYTGDSFYGPFDFALARYAADGKLDSSFGEGGKEITHLGGNARLQGITLHQNKLYAVGDVTIDATNTYGVVAAYQLEAPEPTISIADVTVSESKKLAVVTVRLSKPTNKVVRVHFITRDKTAVHSQDYLSISGPLLFIPGVNTTAKIIIPILDDNQQEGDEHFEIVLSNAHNATIQDSIGVVTILDNDGSSIAKQSTSLHINVSPNPAADVFTIQLQGSNLKQPVIVRVYDLNGRMIGERSNISIGQSFHLGEQFKTGTYIIEAVQGSHSIQTKVIKTGK
jgi:hypothetical protein